MGSRGDPVVAKEIAIAENHLVVVAGHDRYEIPWAECSERLSRAKPFERIQAFLSPGGYGIHWPLLDEDIAIESLLSLPTVSPCPFENRR